MVEHDRADGGGRLMAVSPVAAVAAGHLVEELEAEVAGRGADYEREELGEPA